MLAVESEQRLQRHHELLEKAPPKIAYYKDKGNFFQTEANDFKEKLRKFERLERENKEFTDERVANHYLQESIERLERENKDLAQERDAALNSYSSWAKLKHDKKFEELLQQRLQEQLSH